MQGWTLRDGLWRNDSVESSADAVMRGGSMAFDPATLGTVTLPWSDGSGDLLRHTPILPPDTVVGIMEETDYGFRFPCSGPLTEIAIVDSRDETMWGLHNGLGSTPGAKVIWTMPVSQVKDDGDGVWKPKRSVLSGCEFDVCVQPRSLVDYEPDGITVAGERPAWAAGAAMVYGRGKANNLLHADGSRDKCYATGKLAQFPAHFACFWKDGRLIGRVTGWYEWNAADSHLVKCLPLAECMAFINAGAATVSVDDTLGYTSIGASQTTSRQTVLLGPFTAASTFNVSKAYTYTAANFTHVCFFGLYPNNAGTPQGQSPVTNSQSPDLQLVTGQSWQSVTYSSQPAINAGSAYHVALFNKTLTFLPPYDANTGTAIRRNATNYTSIPDPCPTLTLVGNNFACSLYVEGTGGGGGGATTARYLHLSKMRMQ